VKASEHQLTVAVEAAAKNAFERVGGQNWETARPLVKFGYRDGVLPIVSAALESLPDPLDEVRSLLDSTTVGTFLAGRDRTSVWEVIDTKTPDQWEFGHTSWFLAVNRATGEQHAIPPRSKTRRVKVLTREPDENLPVYTPPSDKDEIALLADQLGAHLIAQHHKASGEVWCPDYNAFDSVGDNAYGREEMEHLRICHGIDTSGIEMLPAEEQVKARAEVHGQAHNPKKTHVGKGGFPHRHAPEYHLSKTAL
jgi:hypothetical protein